MSVDWEAVRAEFPALRDWVFLNTATFGQMPRKAVEAISRHFARRDRLACDDFMEWFDDADRIRSMAARLIGCEPSDIAFVPNASTALSLLLGGIEWKPGDRIVTLQDEFPNQYYYPSRLRRHGVEFVDVPFERLFESVTPRTRVVLVSTVNYSTGFRAPLAELSSFLRERGILLYVDGTQSLGALRFNTASVQPDMFAVHAYKWLLSPNGAGFMYVPPRVREWLEPAVIGWRSHEGWRNHDQLHHGAPQFRYEAEKYEGGMLPFAVLYAMGVAIEMVLDLGPDAIERRVMELAIQTQEVLRNAGAILLCDQHPHYDSPVVTARFPNADASALARELKARHVLVAARHGNLRVSPHFYNNQADLVRLAQILGELGFTTRTSLRIPQASSRRGE